MIPKIQKKLFKWVGGKKWIRNELNSLIENYCSNDDQITTYVEPCAGGLGSFLNIAEKLAHSNVRTVYLNDVNDVLISTFKFLKHNNDELFRQYIQIEHEYAAKIPNGYINLTSKEIKLIDKKILKDDLSKAQAFFLKKREEFNAIKYEESILRSALFIFLMQHLFNGVYRENKKGLLNTGYNWEPNIASGFVIKEVFNDYKQLFVYFDVHFSTKDVEEFISDLDVDWSKTICYIDPPFMNEKNNELSYNKNKFNKEKQIRLLEIMKNLKFKYLLYSNHDFPIFRNFAKEMNLKIFTFHRNNRINPNNPIVVSELLLATHKYESENNDSNIS